ncbi:pumilio homolog 23 [Hevea brasiliensis]|uniref:pumilio homolog 23 n=1 Tax=Hevea brasiliensis TaxID=3981 RepID=UPI0025F562CD|nr:pumilio homolog 23 [Hevea brasiliensis]
MRIDKELDEKLEGERSKKRFRVKKELVGGVEKFEVRQRKEEVNVREEFRKERSRVFGYFGELSTHSSSSFTIEKCFNASNVSLREAIASNLLAVQTELSMTMQGPCLLRKLDINRFANRPDQWRSMQASKQSFYAFGSNETKPSRSVSFIAEASKNTSQPKDIKKMRKEIDHAVSGTVGTTKKAVESTHQIPFLSVDTNGKKLPRKYKPTKVSKKNPKG